MLRIKFWNSRLLAGSFLMLSLGLGGCVLPDAWVKTPNLIQAQPITAQKAVQKTPAVLDADLIRVGLSDNAMTAYEYPSVTLGANGPYAIISSLTGQTVMTVSPAQTVKITRSSSGLLANIAGKGVSIPLGSRVIPLSATGRLKLVSVKRKGIVPTYRGYFELVPGYSGPQRFSVVNVLPLQDYLKAVVPNELPYFYGYEAVKAQAVAARNYAIRPREKPWPQFDICDSQYCQAYYGENTEHPQTTKAIAETQGLVALYQGEPILALYSSSHGGHSENYEFAFSEPKTNRFPASPIPYLSGQPDLPHGQGDLTIEANARKFWTNKNINSFDVKSPHYRWTKSWSRADLESVLNETLSSVSMDSVTKPFVHPQFQKGQRIGRLKAIKVTRRGVSGKIMQLQIAGSNGTWTVEKEFVVRRLFKTGAKFLPSANVVFTEKRDSAGNILLVSASGGGFGHGVGMSQLGASWLSQHGRSFVEILQHYYKGIAVGTVPLIASFNQGMKTEFYVPVSQGKLRVKLENLGATDVAGTPIKVSLNDREIVVIPDASGRYEQEITSYLNARQLNELKVFPLLKETGKLTAWIELYPSSVPLPTAASSASR